MQTESKKRVSKRPAYLPLNITGKFAAIDFETADFGRDSACAVSVVIVENNIIHETYTSLVRPPRRSFQFTYIHGITWNDVRDQPTFGEIWPSLAEKLHGIDILAAHNASFDRSVLNACCEMIGESRVDTPFLCTVKLAKSIWELKPATLADVARHLQIPLKHHDAESDAQACANILIKAREQDHDYEDLLSKFTMKPAKAKA